MNKKEWYRRQQQKQRAPKGSPAFAMNSTVDYRTGMGGIQDRGIGLAPSLSQWQNPFVYGNNRAVQAREAWAMYQGDWIAKKIVDIPVWDMFREGWNLTFRGKDTDIDQQIQDRAEKIGIASEFSRAKRMEAIFGGCALVIGVRSEKDDYSQPLDPDMVDVGDFQFLNLVTRNYIQKVDIDTDITSPGYGRPLQYHVRDKIIHRSRLIIFDGDPVSRFPGYDFMAPIAQWDGMGVSVFAPVYAAIMRANAYQQGAAHLSQMASVVIGSIKGLADHKMTRAGQNALSELQQMAESLSMYNAYLFGSDVDIKQVAASFGSVPELIMSGLQIISAASDIPATRFLGEAPGGLNSDGKSSLENYYNSIRARQTLHITPLLKQILPFLINTTFGRGSYNPDDFEIEWQPLWNMSKTEEAQIRNLNISAALQLVNAGLYTDENAVRALQAWEAISVIPSLKDLEQEKMEKKILDAVGIGEPQDGDGGTEEPKKPRIPMPRLPSMSSSYN